MSSRRTIRDNAIAGLIVATVVGVVSAAWPPTRKAMVAALSSLGTHYSLRLPLWGWLLVWCFVAVVTIRRLLRKGPAGPAIEKRSQIENGPPLTELERKILRMLWEADGADIPVSGFAIKLQARNLVIDAALRSLQARGLIDYFENVYHGALATLSLPGRDFVLHHPEI